MKSSALHLPNVTVKMKPILFLEKPEANELSLNLACLDYGEFSFDH